MRALFTIILFTCIGSVVAQLQISSDEFPVGGIDFHHTLGFNSGNIGATGQGQSYDFSSLISWRDDTITYYSTFGFPFANFHPGAQFARVVQGGTIFVWYYSSSATAYAVTGVTLLGNFGMGWDTVHAEFSPGLSDTLLSTDYEYGHTETERWSYRITLAPGFDYKQSGYKIIEVDGEGTLDMPLNQWDSVLRVRYVDYRFDTVFSGITPIDTSSDTLYYYKYFSKGVKYPVAIAITDEFDNIQYMESVYIPDVITGCTDPFAINYNPLANQDDGSCEYCGTVPYILTADTGICAGETVQLDVSGANYVAWSTGATTNSITVTPVLDAIYSVYVSDDSSCWDLGTVEVKVTAKAEASFWTIQGTYQIGDTIQSVNTSTDATNYSWNFDDVDGTTSSEKNPTMIYKIGGEKQVSMVATNNCSIDSYTGGIFIDFPASVDAIGLQDGFRVYPTLSSGRLKIQFNSNGKGHTSVYIIDVMGRQLYHSILPSDQPGLQTISLDNVATALPSGLYFLQMEIEGETRSTHQVKWIKM